MRGSQIVGHLTVCLAAIVMPLATISPVSARPAKATAPARPAAMDPAHADRAILAIAAREEKCRDKGLDLSPDDNEACSSRAMAAAEALVPRGGTQKRFAALMRDLVEPMVFTMSDGDPGEAHEVTALYSEAELAQERAAILTNATNAERALKRAETEDMGDAPPARKHPAKPHGLFDWVDKNRHFMESPGANIHTRPLALRWQAIRDADCAAYPVPHCAARLDAAMRDMFEDLED